LLVQAPSDFIGFEAVELIVSDPSGQTDILPLRIYSSDGTPVAGGIPDVVLEKGEENRETDLDNYYFDSDNIDEEVQWSAVNLQGQPFDSEHLQISIDRLTHLITYFATDSNAFLTESVILRVTDPAGNVGIDTVQVSVISGGGNPAWRYLLDFATAAGSAAGRHFRGSARDPRSRQSSAGLGFRRQG